MNAIGTWIYLNDSIASLLFQSWKPEEARDGERMRPRPSYARVLEEAEPHLRDLRERAA